MKFKGFDDWIPIFRGGKQIDSSGKEHDGDALIDKALANFNIAAHEPPACVGHPNDNKPAYGWVEGLKKGTDKLGALLLAKFKQVEPTFGTMVQEGRFKKRSAAFYPDGTLRHVAFLGAMPPAVKGLPDVAFAEGEAISFEFSEAYTWNSLADIFRRLREHFIEKEGQDTADRLIPDWKIEDFRAAAEQEASEPEEIPVINNYHNKEDNEMNLKQKFTALFNEMLSKMPDDGTAATGAAAQGKQFSEADLEAAKNVSASAEREKVTREFEEKAKISRQGARKARFQNFASGFVAQGKITGATVKFGLPEILSALAEQENQIEFGENKEKITAYDRMKDLLSQAKPMIAFGEVATRDKDAGGTSADAREQAITKYQADHKVGYKEAILAVSKAQPALFAER